MNAISSTQRPMLHDTVLLISRLLLATIFLHEGAFLVANFAPTSASMAKLGVPPFLFVATIALQLVAGSAITAGWHARWERWRSDCFASRLPSCSTRIFPTATNCCISRRISRSPAECLY